MPRPTIDYLNARRESANRNRDYSRVGGKFDTISAETQRAWADAAAAYVPSLEDKVAAVFDDFRSWCRNREPIALMIELGGDQEIPF